MKKSSQLLLMGALVVSSFSARADVVVANSRQIPGVLSTVTGVSQEEDDIKAYFESNSSKLPALGQLSEVTASFLLTELSYSSLYCQKFVTAEETRPSAQRWALQAVDFSQPLSQFSEASRLKNLVGSMSMQFWGRVPSADERADMAQELKTWIDAPDGTGEAAVESFLVSYCSVLLSAPALWMEAQ